MGAWKGHWIRVDALLPQSVQLLAAYPDLLRQTFDGQGLSQSVGFFRNVRGHLCRIFLAGPFQLTCGWFLAVPAQHR